MRKGVKVYVDTEDNTLKNMYYAAADNHNEKMRNKPFHIDAGYRGHLIGMFDVVGIKDYFGKKFDRYAQICAPGLVPIVVEIVETKEDIGLETGRGENGLGSSGR